MADKEDLKIDIGSSEEMIRAILNALNKSVIVSITDPNGNITYANDKFLEVSKYSREELIGENHRILKSGFHSDSFYNMLWSAISRGRVWRGDIKNRAKDGTFYWVDSNISPIFDEFGKIQGYVAIRFLITDKKETEEKLKEKNKELENTMEDFYMLRSSLIEGLKRKEIEEENNTIRKKIDRLKK
jgi:PAS domain S-box-containing protein